ncbi:flagellar hook protein FlgE [Halomonas getboli]|uniref:flagellar hook protein FlgE n=1 Tax=Halomonas getboli TaxID=2935862 RepID=UPI001FFF539B|nr:flagellar hook protein FlgE [Halomonas getboli]MCK2184941.1 flagellar hook protein FlgE [Halomonas getboli]
MGFSQALSGLNAASSSLDVLGNNIANSQTVGYKSSSAQFADIFAGSTGLGTKVSAVLQDFGDGNIENTGRNLDLAISGDGFFRFQQDGEVVYSRNGQLSMTADGYLENAQGARIMGYGLNAAGNVQTGGQPGVLQVPADDMAASATTEVSTSFNLDARETVGSDLSQAEVTDATGADTTLNYHFSNNFSTYDSLGNSRNVTVYYEKVDANTWRGRAVMDGTYSEENDFFLRFDNNGQLQDQGVAGVDANFLQAEDTLEQREAELVTATSDRDAAQDAYDSAQAAVDAAQAAFDADSSQANQDALADANTALTAANTELTDATTAYSDALGQRNTAQAAYTTAYNALDADIETAMTFAAKGGAAELTFDYRPTGSTQFGNTSSTSSLTQDGYTSGALVGITIQDDGTVMRNYANEQSVPAGQIALANFRNPEGLEAVGDNAWSATASSGQELLGEPGTGVLGSVQSSAIETSNVDLASQLVDMIVTQRAYQANSQTISTQDEVLQAAINLSR